MSKNNKEKKIIIIGNGESAINKKYGQIIDNFEFIGRINNFQIDRYSNYIGSKTSIWFNGANQGLVRRKKIPDNIVVLIPSKINKQKKDINKFVNNRLGTTKEQCNIINYNTIRKYEQQVDSDRLTTGTYSILWALDNFKEVFIYGFDFFINSKSHYFDNALISILKNKGIISKAKKHDMKKEKAYIDNLISNGKLKVLNE